MSIDKVKLRALAEEVKRLEDDVTQQDEHERLSETRTDWQARCLKRGFEYVRESDDHYVLADLPEMAALLGELLGVEVRSKENDDYGQTVSDLNDQVDAGINAFHRAYEAEKERDLLKAENEAMAAKLVELEKERAEQWRGRRDAEGARDNKAAIAAELRAQLAEAQEVLRDCIEVGELDIETQWKAERVSKGRRLYVDDRALSAFEDPVEKNGDYKGTGSHADL